jgi:GPH family glycoside/pentoside/hexuronide:cation symporter
MLKTRTSIFYGIGGGVYSIKEAAYAVFILLFYTQVLGLSGTVTGGIIAVSLVWDGISDPLIGSWSDRLHSRYGRRHPFMVYSTLPIAIGVVGLFSPPTHVVQAPTLLAAWLLFWSLWLRTFVTAFSIPHLALSAELTSDYHDRSRLLALRLGFMFMITLLLPAAGLLFIFAGGQDIDGRFVAENYPGYGVMSAALAIVLGLITVLGTRHHTSQPDDRLEDYAPPTLRDYLNDVTETFRNKLFRRLISYEIACAVGWGGLSTLHILVATYVFEFDADEMALILALPVVIGVTLVWALMGTLTRRWQKPQLLRFALWGMLFNMIWLYPLKLADLLPPNESPIVLALYLIQSTLFTAFFFLRMTNSMSLVADITDQHELEQGERKEGGFFSVMTFTLKMATLVGPLYGGIALDVIGLDKQALPGDVAEPVLAGLLYAVLLIVIPTLIVALRYSYLIDISRDDIARVQAQLLERKAPA